MGRCARRGGGGDGRGGRGRRGCGGGGGRPTLFLLPFPAPIFTGLLPPLLPSLVAVFFFTSYVCADQALILLMECKLI